MAAFLAAGLFVPGCTCTGASGKALKGMPEVRRAGAEVTCGSGPWRSAAVDIGVSHETKVSGGRVPAPGTYWYVAQTVVLRGPGGERKFVLWKNGGTLGYAEDVARAQAEFTLKFAADGHALAISEDRGATWRCLALDVPGEPLWCPHVVLRAESGGDPFAAQPDTRALVLAMCAAPGAPAHAEPAEAREWAAAAAFAAARPDDVELHKAVARAAILPGRGFLATVMPDPPLAGLRAIARAEAPVGDVLRAALAASDGTWTRESLNAASLLEDCDDEETQSAVAGALARSVGKLRGMEGADLCQLTLARVVARITEKRRAAPPAVEEALVCLLEGAGDLQGELYVLRGLVALDSERARAAVAALAAKAGDGERPPWPASFDEYVLNVTVRNMPLRYEPALWAKAALGR